MPNTLQGVIDYARSHALRDDGSWAGWCASFCYRAGGFSHAYLTALLAGDASKPLNPDWTTAPAGALHYWSGVGGDGHVAFELGDGLLLMASGAVTDRWGTAMGTVAFEDYAHLGIPYRGWSRRWGSETLAGASTASLNEKDIQGEEDMAYLRFITDNPNGAWWATDGMTRRALEAGEAQFLVDIGTAKFEEGSLPVKVVPTSRLLRIPVA